MTFTKKDPPPKKKTQKPSSLALSLSSLYDPRVKEGVLVRGRYTSHSGWVTSVCWCAGREHLFASGGHDGLVKLWDRRSARTPVFDLRGHQDRVLCCHWGEQTHVASGGADNSTKIFKTDV